MCGPRLRARARQADLPSWPIGKMTFKNTVSALGGLVPALGDVFITAYTASSRNAMLFEEFLRITSRVAKPSRVVFRKRVESVYIKSETRSWDGNWAKLYVVLVPGEKKQATQVNSERGREWLI